MKALNTDAVRKLYRGKYAPAKEEPEVNGSQIRGISFRISLAFAALAVVSDRETVKLLEAVMHDLDFLRFYFLQQTDQEIASSMKLTRKK